MNNFVLTFKLTSWSRDRIIFFFVSSRIIRQGKKYIIDEEDRNEPNNNSKTDFDSMNKEKRIPSIPILLQTDIYHIMFST